MKKLLALVLCVAMIACFTVVATAQENVTATVGSAVVAESVELAVTLSDVANGYASVTVSDVTVDNAAVTFKGFNKKSMTLSGMADFGAEQYAFVTTDGGEDYPENKGGVICGLKFDVDTAALTEDATVTVTVVAATYDDDAIVANSAAIVEVVAGKITVAPAISEEAQAVIDAIDNLPETFTLDDAQAVAAAKAAYDALNDAQKAELDPATVAKLDAAVAAIQALTPSTPADDSSVVESKADTSKADTSKADTSKATSKASSKTNVPKTADNNVVVIAAVLCVAMAAAFVVAKKVND